MNQMNTFLKEKFHMKSFDHVKLNTELPDISTQNIEGKRFYVTPEGNKYPSITTVSVSYTHLTLPTTPYV
mgnify:CR=1 FL=1